MPSAADFLDAKPSADDFLRGDVPRGTQAPTSPGEPSAVAGIPGALLSLISSLPAQIGGNIYGAFTRLAYGSSMEEASRTASKAAETTTYTPSPAGQEALKKAAPLMDALIAVQGAMGATPFRTPTAREMAGRAEAPATPKESTAEAPGKPEPAPERPFPVEIVAEDEAAPAKAPEPPQKRPAPAVVETPFPAEAGDLTGVGRDPRPEPPPPPMEPVFELAGETEGQIRAREAAETKAREDKARADAAPSAEDFLLTGSDSVVDEARARGQQELAPAEPAKAAAPVGGDDAALLRRFERARGGGAEGLATAIDAIRGGKLTRDERTRFTNIISDIEAQLRDRFYDEIDERIGLGERDAELLPDFDVPAFEKGLAERGWTKRGNDWVRGEWDAFIRSQGDLAPPIFQWQRIERGEQPKIKPDTEASGIIPSDTGGGEGADIIQHPDGRPWKTKEAARDYAKQEKIKGWVPWKVEGGFVLKPAERTAAQLSADARRRTENSRVDVYTDDLPTIIGKLGGLSREALVEGLGLDPKDVDAKVGFFRSSNVARPSVRKTGGLSLDAIAEKLDEYGFEMRDEQGNVDAHKLHDLIDQHLEGGRVMTPQGYERMAELEGEAQAKAARAAGELSYEETLEKFGPGTFGANAFLDPKRAGRIISDTLKDFLGEPGEFRHALNPIRDAEQHNVARIQRWASGIGHDIREAFPSKAEREDLTTRIVRGDFAGLNESQAKMAQALQAHYQAMGEYAQDAARLEGLRENYSPQIWDMNDRHTRNLIEAWNEAKGKETMDADGILARAMRDAGKDPATFSPFLMRRTVNDIIEGMQLGLKPKSLDAAALFETYARSMGTAIERGKALTALKELVLDDGSMAVIPREQAPRDYVKIDNPELEGMRIHPEIAPSVRVLMETNEPGVVATALQTIAYTTKRALVSYSFFHPKALLEAYVGTGGNPLTVKTAIDMALKQYRDGGVGDVIDRGLANGLKIGAPLEDVLGRDKFQAMIDKAGQLADRAGAAVTLGKFEKSGKPLRTLREVDEQFNRFTWDYLHTGLKLETFTRKYGDLRQRYAEDLANRKITDNELARQASEFTNAIYGGLNWERMLDSFETPTARRVMGEVLSKRGRSWMSTAIFAPDWLISTLGSWTNALGTAERNALKRDLAQRYLAVSAVATLGLGNALNYYFTGHSMFENASEKKKATWRDQLKAKMEVQTGDGRRIQIAKHFSETPHALVDPVQFSLNKLNPMVSEPIEQVFNKRWLSAGWTPPITTDKDTPLQGAAKRALHAAGKFTPITGRQIMEQGPTGLGGFFGFPVYGMTAEQKAKERAERGR